MQPNAPGDDATGIWAGYSRQIFQLVGISMSQDLRQKDKRSAWDRASLPWREGWHRINTRRSFERRCAARYWALVPRLPMSLLLLGFVSLGLEVCKPHSCFVSCSRCTRRRLEEEAQKGCFLSASCSCPPHPSSPSSSWQRLLLLPFGPSLGAFDWQNQPHPGLRTSSSEPWASPPWGPLPIS